MPPVESGHGVALDLRSVSGSRAANPDDVSELADRVSATRARSQMT